MVASETPSTPVGPTQQADPWASHSATPAAPPRARWVLAAPIACGCAIAAAAVYVGLNDPAAPGTHAPACPLYQMTGLWCPGCGLTRATHSLLRGDVGAAFGYNLFFPVFLGAIVVGWLTWMRRSLGRAPRVAFARLPMWLPIAGGVAMVLFGVLRNLPGFESIRP